MQNVLINQKWLKEYSPIPLNFDLSEVKNYVKIAEDIWIRPIIGDALYEELLHQVELNLLTDENMALLSQALYPLEGYAICLEALPFIWAHMNEKGITLGKSDNSDSIDLKELSYVESHLRRQVEYRKNMLIKWLDDRCPLFPLYHPYVCDKGLNNPNPNFQIYGTVGPIVGIN